MRMVNTTSTASSRSRKIKRATLRFLKKNTPVIYPDGTKGRSSHSAKGITVEKNDSSANPDLLLSWSKVEKRLFGADSG